MRRVWNVVAIAAVATGTFASGTARAASHDDTPFAGTVTAVSVVRTPSRAEVVIRFNGDVDVTDFALRSPHRIVVDIKGATLKMGPHAYDGVVRAGIKNLRVAQSTPNVVRVVLDVDSERDYQIDRGNAEVRVLIESSDAFEPWNAGTVALPAPRAPAVSNPNNAAANAATTTKPVSSAASTATVVTPPAVAPAPVRTPPVVAAPVVLAKTEDTTFDVPLNLRVPQQQAGGRITISFRDTDLRDVLAVFADRSGRSIVTGLKSIPITAEITDQPWQTALNEILEAYGLAAVINPRSGVIRVTSQADLNSQRATEPLSMVRIPLNFARADTLAKTLTSLLSTDCGVAPQVVGGASAAGAAGAAGADTPPAMAPAGPVSSQTCAPRGKITAEATTNSLIIYEIASRVDSLVGYAKMFDVKPQQVNIKAQIISINRTNTNQLGIAYDLGSTTASYNSLAPRQTGGTATEFQVTLGGDAFAGVANASRQFASSAAINLLYSTMIGGSSLTSFLDALSQEGLTDVQSVPSVNTVDKKQADLFAGQTIAFLITPPTAPGAIQSQPAQISNVDVGVTLRVTPSISANRMIRLNIYAEQSALQSLTAAGPTRATRHVTNEVIVRDGETAYISGLEQTQATKSRRGIPLLMNLPVLGRLFSQNESIEIKDDLLILITPHILDDVVPPPPAARQ